MRGMVKLTIQQALQLAAQHHTAGRLDVAHSLYHQILQRHPSHPDALHLLGVIAYQRSQLNEAKNLITRAIQINPSAAHYHNNLSNVWRAAHRYDDAIAAARRAVQLRPDFTDAWYNLGLACKEAERFDDAIAAYQKAIDLSPCLPEAHNNLGNAQRKKGDLTGALDSYRRALQLKPDHAAAHSNLGRALREMGEPEQAIAAYDRAIALLPGDPEPLCDMAIALHDLGRYDEALALCRRALEIAPDYPSSHWAHGLLLLRTGQFLEGWREYEWRWKCDYFPSARWSFPQPQWDGSPLAGRTILFHAEQGFGDTLHFIRYVCLVAQRLAAGDTGKLILQCQPQLKELFGCLPGISQFLTPDDPLPSFDVHLPLMSFPYIFGTTVETIPANVPYLHPDPHKAALWRDRLAASDGAPPGTRRVGLVWHGNVLHRNDRHRSMTLSALAPLSAVPGICFHSLQIGSAAAEIHQLAEAAGGVGGSGGGRVLDHANDLHSFSDTAAVIANLDLVIAVDTAVAHLAAAMGKPTWVMLSLPAEWRWLLYRDDSPWYPTVRLFRQTRADDWPPVVASVRDALTTFAQSTL
jgi:tetratricopeptide (TPR) repeat protein